MLGADHQQVALKLPADLLLDAVVHVRRVVRVELVDEDLLGQLDGQAVPVDGDLLHQLPALDPDCERGEGRRRGGKRRSRSAEAQKRFKCYPVCGHRYVEKTELHLLQKKTFYMICRTINHRNM